MQVILVAPPSSSPRRRTSSCARYVPQLALLPHVDAVVCHGGHNTTCEALAHGLPLVIAPIKDDQPIVAEQVVAAGAGLRVKFGRVRRRRAARRGRPRARRAARFARPPSACARSFAAAGGAAAAAADAALEELA